MAGLFVKGSVCQPAKSPCLKQASTQVPEMEVILGTRIDAGPVCFFFSLNLIT